MESKIYELVAETEPEETLLSRGSLQSMETLRDLILSGKPVVTISIRMVKE